MDIDHLHFYVEDAVYWRDWFVRHCGCNALQTRTDDTTYHILLRWGQIPIVLSSPRGSQGWLGYYLQHHPPGVGDLAFRVTCLETTLTRIQRYGGKLCYPPQTITTEQGCLKWCQIQGWGDLRHTLIERRGHTLAVPGFDVDLSVLSSPSPLGITAIDHAVLNVNQGDLATASHWYETRLGFQRGQDFWIETPRSGLLSQVLRHPAGTAQLPINESSTPNSQVEEFLHHNRGSGIQHAAFISSAITQTVSQLRQRQLSFIEIPLTYYHEIAKRPNFNPIGLDWPGVIEHQILVDWSPATPQARLLQTFTRPLFQQPTFFFELIERQQICIHGQALQAEGFGEGNFRALFEAIERDQLQRQAIP